MKIEIQLTDGARKKMKQMLAASVHQSFRLFIKAFS